MMEVISPSKSGTIDKVSFVGVGTKTATVNQIEERFRALGIQVKWQRFRQINLIRNEVEHLFPQLDQKSLQGLISDAFIVVSSFIRDELNPNPYDLLGPDTWQLMLEVDAVYEKEQSE